MTEPQLLGMHYTRVRHRMYAFIHDLLPPVSAKRARGQNDTQQKKDNKLDRTLKFYGDLKNTTIETWRWFSPDNYRVGNALQNQWHMITS